MQDLLAQFQDRTAFFHDALGQFATGLASILHADVIGPWLAGLVSQDASGGSSETLTLTLAPPDLAALAQQTAAGIGTSFDAINTQLKKS